MARDAEQVIADFPRAAYLTSAHRLDQLPADTGREVAFAGRSNAGKSSAINTLCGRRNLARSSKTPGRTRQIVLFTLGPEQRLADLPGFGYAKVSERLRAHWHRTLDQYLRTRASLRGLVLIMDARHPLRAFDEGMLAWCDAADLPCRVLLTKADKLKRGARAQALRRVQNALPDRAGVALFSSRTGLGRDEARAVLTRWLA